MYTVPSCNLLPLCVDPDHFRQCLISVCHIVTDRKSMALPELVYSNALFLFTADIQKMICDSQQLPLLRKYQIPFGKSAKFLI